MKLTLDYKTLQKFTKLAGDSYYLFDIDKFEKNYQNLFTAFHDIYGHIQLAYSYKTNYLPAICKKVDEKGGFAEVVSEMEYDLAIKLHVDPQKIIVNGPYKPEEALTKYLLNGSIVNLDSYAEVGIIKKLALQYPEKTMSIGLRCNFTFSGIEMSRFGFDVENNDFFILIDELRKMKNIDFVNLHCHFPNREVKLFAERVDRMLELYKNIAIDGYPSWIDIGGGLGGNMDEYIQKQLNFEVADYNDYAQVIATKFHNEFAGCRTKPLLIIEPGTALVADTMKFVSKVLEIKRIRNRFIAIVSGSKVNYHPMASKIFVPMKVFGASGTHGIHYESIDISGYTCMEGDYLFKNYCGELAVGDYVMFENVGSYSIVFKPPFIMPNVPIIEMSKESFRIIKRAEKFEDVFQSYFMDES